MTLIQNEDAKYTLTLFESEKKYNRRKKYAQKIPESLYQDETFISDVTTKDNQPDVKTKIQINSTNELRFASETVITISMLEFSKALDEFGEEKRLGTKLSLSYEDNISDLSIFKTLLYYVGYAQAKRIFQAMGIIGWKDDFSLAPYPLYSVWTDAANDETTIMKFVFEAEEDQDTYKIEYSQIELTVDEIKALQNYSVFVIENVDTNEAFYVFNTDIARFIEEHVEPIHGFVVSTFKY